MSEHTPGPWACEGPDMFGDYNIIAQGVTLAVGAVVSNLRQPAEVAANARIAAAAPDLYETERKLCNEVAGTLSLYEDGLRELMGNTNFNVLKLRCDEAFAALSKLSQQQGSDATGSPQAQGQQNEGAES